MRAVGRPGRMFAMLTDAQIKRRRKGRVSRLYRQLYACQVAANRFSAETKLQSAMRGLIADLKRSIKLLEP